MLTGTVKFFDKTKRWGFIKPDDENVNNGEDIFVHGSATAQPITEGDKVTFDTQDGEKGLQAINVDLQ